MSHDEIVQKIRDGLNENGREWGLEFRVSRQVVPDHNWLKIFITSNSHKRNRAAEEQIIMDVEEMVTEESGFEILLIPVGEIEDAA